MIKTIIYSKYKRKQFFSEGIERSTDKLRIIIAKSRAIEKNVVIQIYQRRKRSMQHCACKQNERKYESNAWLRTICFKTNGGLNCGRNVRVQTRQISEAIPFKFFERRTKYEVHSH